MTRMAVAQAREFEALKQLLSPPRHLKPSSNHHVAKNVQAARKIAGCRTDYWILIGTLLIASSSSESSYSRIIKFHSALWTSLSLGFEILLERSFGRPHYLFRSFRIISRNDPVWDACALGDLEQVDRLFAHGQASPYDSTANGANLLHVCLHLFKHATANGISEID